MEKPRLMYSIEEAAALLGISRSKAYQCANSGELRTVRIGARIVVPSAAIGEMVERNGGEPGWAGTGDGVVNQVTVVGRLTRNAELRTTRSGVSMCTMRLAVRKRTRDDTTVFVDVVVFADLADWAAELRKGQPIRVTGRLDQREWTAEDGTPRQAHQVVAYGIDQVEQVHRTPAAS